MSRHRGSVRPEAIEQRFAVRVRVRVPEGGLTAMAEIYHWLDARVGRLGYRVWRDRHAPWGIHTTALFLDDVAVAAELVARFGLEPAPDPAARAHASEAEPRGMQRY